MNKDLVGQVLEEIALEGLDGITLNTLWIRLNIAKCLLNVDEHNVRKYIWNGVICRKVFSKDLQIYLLPKPRSDFCLFNRYEYVHPVTGYCIDPPTVPEDIYEGIEPVSDENIRGSCKYYNERVNITEIIFNLNTNEINSNYDEIIKIYDKRLVIVASQILREETLRITYMNPCVQLTPLQYCILERIGRSRYNGEVTVGKEAVKYKETTKALCYLRMKLLRAGLIRKQMHVLNEYKSCFNRHGLRLMLPRFYTAHLTPLGEAARKVANFLLTQPERECEGTIIRQQLNIMAKLFRSIFQCYVNNFKVREINEPRTGNGAKSSCDIKRYIKLIKPLGDDDDASDDEEAEADEDNDDNDEGPSANISNSGDLVNVGKFFDPSKILGDRTLLTQTLELIESSPYSNGITLRQIGEALSLPKLEARSLCRVLERTNLIRPIRVEVGRQKMINYLPCYKTAVFRQIDLERKSLSYNVKDTIKFYRRANLILEKVKELKIVETLSVFRKMIAMEERNTEPYLIDKKSIRRIVEKLAEEKHVNYVQTYIACKEKVLQIEMVSDPSITTDSPLIRERIEQIKFRFYHSTDEESKKMKINKPSNKGLEKSKQALKTPLLDETEDDLVLVYQPSIGRKYGLEPKMKKIFTLYKFLFFLADFKGTEKVDFDDWRQFIQPIPRVVAGEKTLLLGDVIPRIPLSIFVKIVFITYIIPGLEDYLSDSEKQHETLSMLPAFLRKRLMYKRKFIFSIAAELTSLSYMNLVNITYKELAAKESMQIEILRNPKLIHNDEEINFDLQTLEDVERFITILTIHCTSHCNKCNLDKRLFAHVQRNWTYVPKVRNKITSQISLKHLNVQSLSTNAYIQANQVNTIETERQKSITAKETKKRKKKASESKQSGKSKRSKLDEGTDAETKPKKSKYDATDLVALKLLRRARSAWTKEEDAFLLMCRVASVLLSPNSLTHLCVPSSVVRDELNKNLPEQSKDKTSIACQRRLLNMLKKPETRQNVTDWVIECKEDMELMNISKSNLPKTRKKEWKELFLKTLYTLLTKFQAHHLTTKSLQNVTNLERSFNFSDNVTYNEIISNYNIVDHDATLITYKPALYQDAGNRVDIYMNVVATIFLSTLMMTEKSKSTNMLSHTLFKVYQRYSDTLLRSMVTRLSRNGVIAKIRRNTGMNVVRSRAASCFKVSQNYLFILNTRLKMDTLPTAIESSINIVDGNSRNEVALAVSLLASNNVQFIIDEPDEIIHSNDNRARLSAIMMNKSPSKISSTEITESKIIDEQKRKKAFEFQDQLILNSCKINFKENKSTEINADQLKKYLTRSAIVLKENFQNTLPSDNAYTDEILVLLNLIELKRDLGATKEEILRKFPDWPFEEINKLIDDFKIFRVGTTIFRWVHYKYITPWLAHSFEFPYPKSTRPTSSSKSIDYIPRCWKNIDGTMNLSVLYQYMSCICGHIMINPGIKENDLITHFHICLSPVQIFEIIELLLAIGCITEFRLEIQNSYSLFASDECKVNLINHYEASPEAFTLLCRLKALFNEGLFL